MEATRPALSGYWLANTRPAPPEDTLHLAGRTFDDVVPNIGVRVFGLSTQNGVDHDGARLAGIFGEQTNGLLEGAAK